jgi:geranylgeranyl diphosphate synthase type I
MASHRRPATTDARSGGLRGPPRLPAVRPVGTRAPASLAGVAGRVEARIDSLLRAERARWASVDPGLDQPLAWLQQLVMAGGKRLRPAFCHWAFVGAGGDPDTSLIVDAGAALELLHAFALVHDDIMDASDRRRGMSSVHREFEDRHRRANWRGEGRRFGEGVGILVGDLAFVYADQLMAGVGSTAFQVFTDLRLEVNVGQYLDLVGTARGISGADEARRISLYKSGKYTVERPLQLGAALADELDLLRRPLSAVGVPLGEAFQLRDDLLGAFGHPDDTGKPVGEDLREGKPTVLLAVAAERACGAQARLLAETVGRSDLSPGDIAALQEVLVDTGARKEVEASIDSLVNQAVGAVERAPLLPEARTRLAELAYFVGDRDH